MFNCFKYIHDLSQKFTHSSTFLDNKIGIQKYIFDMFFFSLHFELISLAV